MIDKCKYILIILLVGSLAINLFCLFSKNQANEVVYKEKEVIKRDTVLVHRFHTDTVRIDQTKIKYDTIIIRDTVYIKDIPHNYHFEEDKYTLDINAVKLYDYNLDVNLRDTVTITNTVYNTVYQNKKQRLTYGLQFGAGYGIFNRKPDVYVGFGIQYNF